MYSQNITIEKINILPLSRKHEYQFSDVRFYLVFQGTFPKTQFVKAPNCKIVIKVTYSSSGKIVFTGDEKDNEDIPTGKEIEYEILGKMRKLNESRADFLPYKIKEVFRSHPINLSPQIRITICNSDVLTQELFYIDLSVYPNWSGKIKVILEYNGNRFESKEIPLVLRSWGLHSVHSNSLDSLGRKDATGFSTPSDKPRATYPVQANNWVEFYNNASKDGEGTQGAFSDICKAIDEAKHFIFIADWSFHPEVYLKRPLGGKKDSQPVGKILINKAIENPDLLIAIHTWDHLHGPLRDDPQNNKANETLDRMTKEINGNLNRKPDNLLWRATERSGMLNSQHQKFIVLDTAVPGQQNEREIKVFFGGLDLTTGRFDWSLHPIDPTLGSDAYKYVKQFDDWYNPEFGNDPQLPQLPRQPWHDIHAQLVGGIAWDFVCEFVGRWCAPLTFFTSVKGDKDDDKKVWTKFNSIFKNPEICKIYTPPLIQGKERPWTAQVYRSIEEKFWSCPKSEKSSTELPAQLLKWGIQKQRTTDGIYYEKSIHKAYLQAIKRAERFIYIETQYLIGGSGVHTQEEKIVNKIPDALVERILEMYAQGRDFHVYIVIPLYPEGSPNDFKLVSIRYWQWRTINWMKDTLKARMEKIAQERKEKLEAEIKKIDEKKALPAVSQEEIKRIDERKNVLKGEIDKISQKKGKTWTSYLSFYFLGKGILPANNEPALKPDRKQLLQNSQRYMIYVHSKMMIVDDLWIIIGSANLNERSMAGFRDSEICVGIWPTPGYENICSEKILNFRKELWIEHLGGDFIDYIQHYFKEPENGNVVIDVQSQARRNLEMFLGKTAEMFGKQEMKKFLNREIDNKMNHLMLWDLEADNFKKMYIPDNPSEDDKWLVMPSQPGWGGDYGKDFFL